MSSIMNWKEYKATGVRAVDAVAACIAWHREKQIPIKAIDLRPMAYEQFEYYFKDLMGEDYGGITWDGVEIRKGSILQTTSLLPELWAKPAEA